MLMFRNRKQMFLAAIGIGLITSSASLSLRLNEGVLVSPEDPFCPNCMTSPKKKPLNLWQRERFPTVPQANYYHFPQETVIETQTVVAFEPPCPDCWEVL